MLVAESYRIFSRLTEVKLLKYQSMGGIGYPMQTISLPTGINSGSLRNLVLGDTTKSGMEGCYVK